MFHRNIAASLLCRKYYSIFQQILSHERTAGNNLSGLHNKNRITLYYAIQMDKIYEKYNNNNYVRKMELFTNYNCFCLLSHSLHSFQIVHCRSGIDGIPPMGVVFNGLKITKMQN